MLTCTRCEGTGWLNLSQLAEIRSDIDEMTNEQILEWVCSNSNHDVSVCDCCGDGENWFGEPGSHNDSDFGPHGPYASNGGLPYCY